MLPRQWLLVLGQVAVLLLSEGLVQGRVSACCVSFGAVGTVKVPPLQHLLPMLLLDQQVLQQWE